MSMSSGLKKEKKKKIPASADSSAAEEDTKKNRGKGKALAFTAHGPVAV